MQNMYVSFIVIIQQSIVAKAENMVKLEVIGTSIHLCRFHYFWFSLYPYPIACFQFWPNKAPILTYDCIFHPKIVDCYQFVGLWSKFSGCCSLTWQGFLFRSDAMDVCFIHCNKDKTLPRIINKLLFYCNSFTGPFHGPMFILWEICKPLQLHCSIIQNNFIAVPIETNVIFHHPCLCDQFWSNLSTITLKNRLSNVFGWLVLSPELYT